ncbi:hypothetical protein [Paraburkholderia tropica]|uniref:hypothetical protein n=1 Tax=Paraburkholderia tropica TaxID=92647 RepID=UPI00160D24AE|nr:hypothetical protein [Paraburkholderia tropica]MBB2984631.1 hypothetical protein [Paraburkholderia tropica]
MTESELGSLEDARTIAAVLRAALPVAVDAVKQGITHKTVFYLLVARESLLHRVSGLADDTFPLIDADRYLSAAILTRSMLESTAVLGFLLRSVETFERTNDIPALYGRVARVVVGARNGEEDDPVSVHVLDAIRDSDARLPVSGLMRLYENLSEYAHPNWSGLLGSFGTHENAFHIQLGGPSRAMPALGPYLAIILSSFDHLYGVLGESIEKIAPRLG